MTNLRAPASSRFCVVWDAPLGQGSYELTPIKTSRSRKTPPALKLAFAVTDCQAGGGAPGLRSRARKVKTGTLVKPSMTDTPGVVRGAGKDAQWLSD
eukprot:4104021-Prymnesium_polylepis.1